MLSTMTSVAVSAQTSIVGAANLIKLIFPSEYGLPSEGKTQNLSGEIALEECWSPISQILSYVCIFVEHGVLTLSYLSFLSSIPWALGSTQKINVVRKGEAASSCTSVADIAGMLRHAEVCN
ncbi:hypothetical protein C8F01DRAFT_1141545 [Mycena amicta]|nr:hypothetical protein C8F01DRAFT_1141545 [Mycena amicta]